MQDPVQKCQRAPTQAVRQTTAAAGCLLAGCLQCGLLADGQRKGHPQASRLRSRVGKSEGGRWASGLPVAVRSSPHCAGLQPLPSLVLEPPVGCSPCRWRVTRSRRPLRSCLAAGRATLRIAVSGRGPARVPLRGNKKGGCPPTALLPSNFLGLEVSSRWSNL